MSRFPADGAPLDIKILQDLEAEIVRVKNTAIEMGIESSTVKKQILAGEITPVTMTAGEPTKIVSVSFAPKPFVKPPYVVASLHMNADGNLSDDDIGIGIRSVTTSGFEILITFKKSVGGKTNKKTIKANWIAITN